MPPLNTILFELFRAHDVQAVLRDDDVLFPESGGKVSAATFKETALAQGVSIQLDVRFTIAPGVTIVESFAGIGEDKEQASVDAVKNFAANSLHVFLTAFLRAENDHAAREAWRIGGRERLVTMGEIGVRGKVPFQGEALIAWMAYFQKRVEAHTFSPETHWLRLYYAQKQGRTIVCEVMRDNEPWDEMQSLMSAFSWPPGDDFYSMRLFLVIAGDDSVLTPKRAVAILAETVEANPDATDEEIYAAMTDAGVSEIAAHRAFLFTQIAWGRILLATLSVTFSPDYFFLDAHGNIVESGRVAEEPYFTAAAQVGAGGVAAKGFQRLALTSADVNAVNAMFNNGKGKEGARLGPSLLFTDPPTDAGWAKAQQLLREQNAAKPLDAAKTNPPKWQFWKRGA